MITPEGIGLLAANKAVDVPALNEFMATQAALRGGHWLLAKLVQTPEQ